ncbi:MAG TPA: ATP-binding domain-containing protein [Crocinitomicaceae bacterium]|nr:ATP-binding domain-containing protein [Crocinitomicaceae bacterium]
MGFIANGEILKVVKVGKRENYYGHSFAWATVQFVDYENVGEVEVLLFMDILHNEQPALTREQQKALFFAIEAEHMDERNKQKRYEKVMKSPYFNALQVKFAYAVTCHKSQGGQWETVFVDHGYIHDEFFDNSLNRWLYTAFTRSKTKLFLVGFDERFY